MDTLRPSLLRRFREGFSLTCIFACLSLAPAAETLSILPGDIRLDGKEARQRLLAVKVTDGQGGGELAGVEYRIENPAIAALENGFVVAKGDGQTVLTGKFGNLESRAAITVRGTAVPWNWTFRNHVLPVLSKAGCNSGACHGAVAGKGGFRLSLGGYSPEQDYQRITREALGRRVELADPARSLLLTKPTTAVKHKGGKKLDANSRDYRVLAEWIAHGGSAPLADDAHLQKLEVLPEISSLRKGDKLSLLVRAFYSDGRVEDVTDWVKFSSANEAVARVDNTGHVSVIGSGEGAITAWFSSQIVIARVTVPYPNTVPAQVFAEAPRRNFIDDLTLEQLQRLQLKPSPRADDAEFLRRASLDTIGTLPKPEDVRAFLADASLDKRERLIEDLLSRSEFVDYWSYKWSDMLLVNGRLLRPEAVKAYYQWIRGQVEANTPWDEFVREVVTSKGGSLENGATNFYAVHQDPETMAENVSQAFLSLSIQCAKCHNHPLEKWTNDQYYGFANLFSRVRAKGWGGGTRAGDGMRTLYVESRGELIQPGRGKPQPPAPLDGAPMAFDEDGDRREYLAKWLTAPENPYFSRAIANRVWANFLGVGLVESVDDLRVSNPASNEKLLSALADYLVKQNFDLKALMRVILNSETYQRASVTLPENETETRFYSRYYPRRLMAEVLHDAVVQITDVPTAFDQVAFAGGDKQATTFYEKGTRAIQLYDSAIESYFLQTFGRNERAITCECERSNEPSMVQVLHLSNGDTVNQKLSDPASRITEMVKRKVPDTQAVEDAFLWCLSRYPKEEERRQYVALLAETPAADRRLALEDLYWSLITSREFLFQH